MISIGASSGPDKCCGCGTRPSRLLWQAKLALKEEARLKIFCVCWLKPFLEQLGHKARRRMCPLYVAGLIGPGDRKSVQPMAGRLAPGDYDQLHHFVAAGVWDAA